MLTIALPKGSLDEQTLLLFSQADLEVKKSSREYNPTIDDPRIGKVKILRPQEIPIFVQDGYFDLGISGFDWVTETGADVVEVAELPYAKTGTGVVQMVLAVPDDSPVKSARDITPGSRITTEFPEVTKRFFDGARHPGRGPLQLRRDRGQGARHDGRARRPHRDRLDAAPQRSQDRRHRAHVDDPPAREQGSVGRSGEAPRDRGDPHAAARRHRGARARAAVDERARGQARRGHRLSAGDEAPHGREALRLDDLEVTTVADKSTVNILIPQLKAAGAEDILEIPISKIVK